MYKKIIIAVIIILIPLIFVARAKQRQNDAQIPNTQVLKKYYPWATLKINQISYDITPYIGKTALEALKNTAPDKVKSEEISKMILNDKSANIPAEKYILQDRDTIEWK